MSAADRLTPVDLARIRSMAERGVPVASALVLRLLDEHRQARLDELEAVARHYGIIKDRPTR